MRMSNAAADVDGQRCHARGNGVAVGLPTTLTEAKGQQNCQKPRKTEETN